MRNLIKVKNHKTSRCHSHDSFIHSRSDTGLKYFPSHSCLRRTGPKAWVQTNSREANHSRAVIVIIGKH